MPVDPDSGTKHYQYTSKCPLCVCRARHTKPEHLDAIERANPAEFPHKFKRFVDKSGIERTWCSVCHLGTNALQHRRRTASR